MTNLNDVLREHKIISICKQRPRTACPPDTDKGCASCPLNEIRCSSDCKRCGQDALLAWQRENCKLERVKLNSSHVCPTCAMHAQLSQDQQTINKILGVE